MIELAIPPSVKHIYRYANGHAYKILEAAAYQAHVAWTVKVALIEARTDGDRSSIVRAAEAERISLRVLLVFPDRRRRDLDNCMSLIFDGIAAGLDTDDSRIVELHVVKKIDRERPGCWIWLDEAEKLGGA